MSDIKVPVGYIVIKQEDFESFCNKEDVDNLHSLLSKITLGRARMGKKPNTYILCNVDEPYAEKVYETVLEGERAKEVEKIMTELTEGL